MSKEIVDFEILRLSYALVLACAKSAHFGLYRGILRDWEIVESRGKTSGCDFFIINWSWKIWEITSSLTIWKKITAINFTKLTIFRLWEQLSERLVWDCVVKLSWYVILFQLQIIIDKRCVDVFTLRSYDLSVSCNPLISFNKDIYYQSNYSHKSVYFLIYNFCEDLGNLEESSSCKPLHFTKIFQTIRICLTVW